MEHIRFSFKCYVLRKSSDGFTGLIEGDYIIKFRDSKHKHLFDEGDNLLITLENTAEQSREEVKKRYSIIYVVVHSFLSNGFLFRDYVEKKSFFWSNRGMITHKKFEDSDIFNEGDILKMIIRKA